MDYPIKVSQLKSATESKEILDKLFKVPIQQIQKSSQRSGSKTDQINELRLENSELKNTVQELKQRILELETLLQQQPQQVQVQSIEEEQQSQEQQQEQQQQGQQQFQEEMTEEEKSVHLALLLQQQEEMEFQNRLMQMQNNVDLDEMSYEQLQELQEQMGFVSRGLLKNQIQGLLKQCKITNIMSDCCTICLEDSGNPVEIQLDCGHVFHQDCISEWLSREKHCPVCKRDIDLTKYK